MSLGIAIARGRRGGNISLDLYLFILLYNTNYRNKLKFMSKKVKTKLIIDCKHFLQSTKSPHIPLRGKAGQLSKRKRVLCWCLYRILLVYGKY